jgi:hypothetical protein
VTRTRTIRFGAIVLGMAALGWWSCSGDGGDRSIDSGDVGAGASGTGAVGGTSGAGPGGSTASGGTSWGPLPKWNPTGVSGAGCRVDRLANPSEIRLYMWKPCEWDPEGCEDAVFNPYVFGTRAIRFFSGTVHDDGKEVRLGLAVLRPTDASFFAAPDGSAPDGIRLSPDAPSGCSRVSASVWGKRFGVKMTKDLTEWGGDHGGILGEIGALEQPVRGFTLTEKPVGGPQYYLMGSERWLWEWAPRLGYTTVSALDGSGYHLIAEIAADGPFLYLGPPVATGPWFLFGAFSREDGAVSGVSGKLWRSNGPSALEMLLEPDEPDTHYVSPIYAHSHLAFFKGVHILSENKYERVELWATPYSDDPAKHEPIKLADLTRTSIPVDRQGAFGFAQFGGGTGEASKAFVIWDLANNVQRTVGVPDTFGPGYPARPLGMTRDHLWSGLTEPDSGGASSRMIRIRLR